MFIIKTGCPLEIPIKNRRIFLRAGEKKTLAPTLALVRYRFFFQPTENRVYPINTLVRNSNI